MRKRYCVLVLIALVLTVHTPTTLAEDPPPGTATGQKIGTIVKTAIGTALPAVQPLLDLIWQKAGKSDGDKVKKEDLKSAAEAARKQLLADAQAKMQPITLVAGELVTLNKFLTPSVVANENVIRMQTRLSAAGTGTISDADWQRQTQDWAVAKSRLNTMGSINDAEVDKVRDLWLRNTLKKIKALSQDLVLRVDGQMTAKDVASLKDSLRDLSGALNDVDTAVGYEISDLQSDLDALAKWANGAASGDLPTLTEDQKTFKEMLDAKYNKQTP